MPTKEERAAASRENGKKGGRRARKSADEKTLRAYLEGKLNLEMESSAQFLIDLRDGLVLGCTVSDRRLAAVDLLELTPAIQRTRAEIAARRDQAAGEAAQRTVKHIVDTDYAPPPGWTPEGSPGSDLPGVEDESAPLEFDDAAAPPTEGDEGDEEDEDDDEVEEG